MPASPTGSFRADTDRDESPPAGHFGSVECQGREFGRSGLEGYTERLGLCFPAPEILRRGSDQDSADLPTVEPIGVALVACEEMRAAGIDCRQEDGNVLVGKRDAVRESS